MSFEGEIGNESITFHPEVTQLKQEINYDMGNIIATNFDYFLAISIYIKRWNTSDLILRLKGSKNIIKSIENISFTHLRYFTVRGNNIESIQGLSRIAMPSVQEIYINENKFISIKDFRRSNMRDLKVLSLNTNPLDSIEGLTEGQMPVLNCVYINWEQSDNYKGNLSPFAKLHRSKKQKFSIYMHSPKPIRQNHLKKVFEKQQITIYYT